jgi:cytochrome bd-type quinol oxidase subunit 2
MIYALAYVLFILLFTTWLGSELNRKFNLKDNWPWILVAALLGLAGSLVNHIYPSRAHDTDSVHNKRRCQSAPFVILNFLF